MRENKRLYGLLMFIMSLAVTCLSFGVLSFNNKTNAETHEVANAVSANGGALYVGAGATVTLGEDSKISGITGATNGGAIYVAGTLIINGGTIENCSATYGGAIYIASTGTVTINSGTISGCSATSGGAIYNRGGTLTINGGTITGCSATSFGGGIGLLASGSKLQISNGEIKNCTTNSMGGGVYLANGTTMLVDCRDYSFTIDNCDATGSNMTYGGGVYCANGSTCDFDQSAYTTISNCSADFGGGIYYENQSSLKGMRLYETSFLSCEAINGGGAIYVGSNNSLELISTTFTSCTANVGGAIYADSASLDISFSSFSNCSASDLAGAIFQNYGDLHIGEKTSFSQCQADYSGGAISIASPTTFSIVGSSSNRVTFELCSVPLSEDSYGGGAIDLLADEIVDEQYGFEYVAFIGCSANSGGALYLSGFVDMLELDNVSFDGCQANNGGAINVVESKLFMYSGSFTSCYSDYSGGAIYAEYNSTVVLDGPSSSYIGFDDCVADEAGNDGGRGGAISLHLQSSATIKNVKIIGSYSFQGGAIYADTCTINEFNAEIYESSCSEEGGGIFLTNSICIITGGTIENCSGCAGGGIFVDSYSTLNTEDATSFGIFECSALDGGGIYYHSTKSAKSIELRETTISGCVASNSGGGVFIGGYLTLESNGLQVYDCEAKYGGGIYTDMDANLSLYTSQIYSNKAVAGLGANIDIYAQSTVIVGSGTSIYSPKTGYNIYIYDRTDFTILSGSTIGSDNPTSNDRIYSEGWDTYIYYRGGYLYSIIDNAYGENTFYLNPTKTITIEVGTTITYASSSNIDLADFKSATSGYAPAQSGTTVYLEEAPTGVKVYYEVDLGILNTAFTCNGTSMTAGEANAKYYQLTSGSFTATFSGSMPGSTTVTTGGITQYKYFGMVVYVDGTSNTSNYNLTSSRTTISVSVKVTKLCTISVHITSMTSPLMIGALPEVESVLDADIDVYYDEKKYIPKHITTYNVNAMNIDNEEKYVIKANRLKIV